MWFKNLQIYRLAPEWQPDLADFADQLARMPLQKCGSQDMQTLGWVEPRPDGGLVHAVNGQWLIALGAEQKLLPASVVNQFARDRAREIEEAEGRRVGRKEQREIRERITEELLPRAFTRRRATWAWIDPVNRWLVVDAAAQGKAEEVLELLRKSLDTFPAKPLQTEASPLGSMTAWVADNEAPAGFTLDQDLELRAVDEGRATVRYVRHALEGEEIRAHVAAGKAAVRLGMTWNDRISFVLDEQLQVKRLAFLDILKDENDNQADNEAERFDLDFALMSGELARLLDDLIAALGGEKIATA
jgi:recombination associated protein RdgC